MAENLASASLPPAPQTLGSEKVPAAVVHLRLYMHTGKQKDHPSGWSLAPQVRLELTTLRLTVVKTKSPETLINTEKVPVLGTFWHICDDAR